MSANEREVSTLLTFVNDQNLGLPPSLVSRLASLDTANLPVNVMHAGRDSTP